MVRLPHKLELYQHAVQHPAAEVGFLLRAYHHYRRDFPTTLKEDFAGGAAVAATFVALDENHRALAVDAHGPTLRWAQTRARRELGDRAIDLHLLCADVLAVATPKVDVIAALNFSTFIYHGRASLRRYFQHARRSLATGGVVVIDAYGGPGAMAPGVQKRHVKPATANRVAEGAAHAVSGDRRATNANAPPNSRRRERRTSLTLCAAPTRLRDAVPAFDYLWEQRDYDAVTARVDCRIHFAFRDGRLLESAFRYDWRLWTLPELVELMREAGFAKAEVWCDEYDADTGQSDGQYRPLKSMPPREDWVAYVVGVK